MQGLCRSHSCYEYFQIRQAPCLRHAPAVGEYTRGIVQTNLSEITEENEGTNRTAEGRNGSLEVVRNGNEPEPKPWSGISIYVDYA